MSKKNPKKPHQNERGSPRAYLVTMANRHARDNVKMQEGKALGAFIMSCPSMPKDECDWLSEHYLKVRRKLVPSDG